MTPKGRVVMVRFARGSMPRGAVVVLGVSVVALALLMWSRGRVAPAPEVFSEHLTFAAAEARAAEEHRVVVAVATADWCGPCQAYKRGALADPAVTAWVDAHAVPVMIDVTNGATADAERLGVTSIPATYVVRDGKVVASAVGNASAEELVAMLESAAGE